MSHNSNSFISIEGLEELQHELKKLNQERDQAIKAVSEGRQHGDLRENAEYESAKHWQLKVESKIAQFERMITNSKPVNIKSIPKGNTVQFGVKVSLQAYDPDKRMTVQILGEHEAKFEKNQISVTSPLAVALLGKKVGDFASVKAPKGEREYEILELIHDSEAS